MAEEPQPDSNEVSFIQIVVDGLRKSLDLETEETCGHSNGAFTERVSLRSNAPLSELWRKLTALGYESPASVVLGGKRFSYGSKKTVVHPFEEIEVVEGRTSETGKCININDPLISFTNRQLGEEFKLNIGENWENTNGTALHNLTDGRGLEITFHRTVRMPDDDKLHQLPASLGVFPLFNVDAYADSLPSELVHQGGVFLPMWQREALWINFEAPYGQKYALRVFVGRVNAVSGLSRDESSQTIDESDPLQDYVVIPGQQWLDGICVAPGIVRQFVAMPLGSGYTVEGQKTGEEKHGGLQIEIIPSYKENLRVLLREPRESTENEISSTALDWSRRIDELKTSAELSLLPGDKIRSYPANPTGSVPYVMLDLIADSQSEETHVKATYPEVEPGWGVQTEFKFSASMGHPPRNRERYSDAEVQCLARPHSSELNCSGAISWGSEEPTKEPLPTSQDGSSATVATKNLKEMGLAAGGKLVQDIYRDLYPGRIWNTEAARLVNIHILDPASCEAVTHIVPQPPPIDAAAYAEANMPFFVIEEQVDNRVDGGDFDNVISVSAMDNVKGVSTEPSLDPSKPSMCKVCEARLCDCIIRPCDHQFCNVCIKALDRDSESESTDLERHWKCPTCEKAVSHVAGFSAPMNLPGEETLKIKVPVHVLEIEDGRVQFKSIQRTRV